MTAEEVRAALDRLGLRTQGEIAKAFEVDARTVRRWERHGMSPGPARVALRLMTEKPARA
jgi:DNA-binding transcriptional regulator YiaG